MVAINTKDPQMLENDSRNIRNESDAVLSIVSMSLENLFMIRPRGVVSKKLMGACITEVIVLRWRDFDAKYVKGATTAPEIKNMMVNETPKAA
jgi:hypothetical protein